MGKWSLWIGYVILVLTGTEIPCHVFFIYNSQLQLKFSRDFTVKPVSQLSFSLLINYYALRKKCFYLIL